MKLNVLFTISSLCGDAQMAGASHRQRSFDTERAHFLTDNPAVHL